MNQSELINHISLENDIDPKLVKRILDAANTIVAQQLYQGNKVRIGRLGQFEPRHVKAYTAKNPVTGEPVPVAAKIAPRFKPSDRLKSAVNTGEYL